MAEWTFEQAMTRLEQIVATLESGRCTLDDSLKLFEEGTKLTAYCAEQLKSAEQKILKLTAVEAGETERETALREIYEEVGIRPRLIDGFREESRYMLPRSTIRKTVVLFLAEYENQKIHPQKEELIDAPLLSYEEALTRLLKYTAKGQMIKEFDDSLFTEHVDHIVVFERTEIGFAMKCGPVFRERIG